MGSQTWPAAFVAAFLLLAASACTADVGSPGAKPGTVLTDSSSNRHIFVMTPIGRIDFTVTEPTEDLPVYNEAYSKAADGASFIGVSWSWDFRTRPAPMTDGSDDDPTPMVELRVDDRRYSIADAMTESDRPIGFRGTAWVAVSNTPDELAHAKIEIAVDYDGVEQTVSLGDSMPGQGNNRVANTLYSPRDLAVHRLACGTGRAGKGKALDDMAKCNLEVMRVPYYEPVGWASDAHGWTVITVHAYPGSYLERGGRGADRFGDGPANATYRLGDEEPVKVLPADTTGSSLALTQTVVFHGASVKTFTVDASFPSEEGARIPVTWSTLVY